MCLLFNYQRVNLKTTGINQKVAKTGVFQVRFPGGKLLAKKRGPNSETAKA